MENAVMMSPHSVDTTHVSATPETKVTPRRKAKKFDIVNFLLPVFIGLYGISSVADTMIRLSIKCKDAAGKSIVTEILGQF